MNPALANVLMVQSLGYINEKGGEGSVCRIQAARELVEQKRIPSDALMVWPQGYQKRFPTVKTRKESLGESLADYCRSIPEFAGMKIASEPLTWGTDNDILAAYDMVRREGWEAAHFHFVSDRAHMRRIRLVWALTHPKGWTAAFYSTPRQVLGFKDRFIREPVAYLWYVVKLSTRRFL